MFDRLSDETRGRLWPHQAKALDFAIRHLNRLDSPCLIRMPTGTGKTGVIACLTRLSNRGSSLVLTPWAHLRKQMVTDLESGFWRKVKLKPRKMKIVPMFPSTAKDIVRSGDPQVIVATFATLNDLRLNHVDTYQALAGAVSLVLVDEGHYEPALEWGKSVKGLKTRTVLLTATPYRNDLKLFRITDVERSTHHYTHKQAVAEGIIRRLGFEELASLTDVPSLSAAFANKWTAAKRAKTLPSKAPRAIICCSNANDIEVAVTHLRMAGLKAIGIHEQFGPSTGPSLLNDVPDPGRNDAEVWVHQHKLTEGLDDHHFCCIALFTRIRNARKLVQQVGRVLRRDPGDRNAPAILLAPARFSAEAEWSAYLDFETEFRLLEPKHFRNVVETLLSVQPEVEYFEGRFRRRFRPENLSQRPQVIIPPSVLVRAIGKDFSLDDYIEDCTDTLNTEDAVILGPDINAPCQRSLTFAVWVYASVRNSRLLQDTSLYEARLETHCVVVAHGFAFITDSRGNYPVEYLEEHTRALSPEELARFFDKSLRPTHVSVQCSIPYDTVLRGAELRGHNLLSIPASLTDHVQICRSARGSSKESGRKYVGLSDGRVRKEVSEEDRRTYELETFVSWAESVGKTLKSTEPASDLFLRYMPTCPPPEEPTPKTISLDISRLDPSLTMADGRACSLRSSSSDVKESAGDNRSIFTCSFNLEGKGIAGESVSIRVEYQPTKRRFWFYREGNVSVQVELGGGEESSAKSLPEFLNQNQDVVLMGLEGGEIVYQGRNFYRIDYTYAERVLLGFLRHVSNAPPCRTEKGTKAEITAARRSKATAFPEGSLFRAIADRHVDLPFVDEVLICADLGTECADFVAANLEGRQLALIHAKAGDGRKVSASSFHEVVAQAMKNLVYLTGKPEVPKGVGSWRHDAKWNRTNIPRLYRSRQNLPCGKGLWDLLRSHIIGSSNPELYVVLLTTGCCDLQELKQATSDSQRRTPEIAQLFHLLDGLSGHARQLGIRLIVYDLPYKSN